jgi:hypothetical protein
MFGRTVLNEFQLNRAAMLAEARRRRQALHQRWQERDNAILLNGATKGLKLTQLGARFNYWPEPLGKGLPTVCVPVLGPTPAPVLAGFCKLRISAFRSLMRTVWALSLSVALLAFTSETIATIVAMAAKANAAAAHPLALFE